MKIPLIVCAICFVWIVQSLFFPFSGGLGVVFLLFMGFLASLIYALVKGIKYIIVGLRGSPR